MAKLVEQQDVLACYECALVDKVRLGVVLGLGLAGWPRAPPAFRTIAEGEAHDVVTIDGIDRVASERHHQVRIAAQNIALGDGADESRLLHETLARCCIVHKDSHGHAPADILGRAVDGNHELALVQVQFAHTFRTGIRELRFTRTGREAADGGVRPKGNVDVIPHSDESPVQLDGLIEARTGRLAVAPGPPSPFVYAAFPKHDPVESVARDQAPPLRNAENPGHGFVQDVERSSLRRHHGTETDRRVVVLQPQWSGNPLQPGGRRHDAVGANRVTVGRAARMSPFVQMVGPGLTAAHPPAVLSHEKDAARGNGPQQLIFPRTLRLLHDQGIDEVVGEGQAVTAPGFERDAMRKPKVIHAGAGLGYGLRAEIQPAGDERIADEQGRRLFATSAAEVHDQPAGNAGVLEQVRH